jgi:hypothetical protein
MLRYTEKRGQSGHTIEEEVLGEVTRPAAESYDEWKKHESRDRQIFKVAVENVKKCQPPEAKPSRPAWPFPKRVHALIMDKIGSFPQPLLDIIDDGHLKYFTCVHYGEMDYRRGIDAIFELELLGIKDGKPIIVSLDITTDPNSDELPKANVVFSWPRAGLDPELAEDREEWEQKVEEVASQAAIVLESWLNKINRSQKERRVA